MFKWLDLLEKEFDRSFVQLDLLLGEVEEENKQVTTLRLSLAKST